MSKPRHPNRQTRRRQLWGGALAAALLFALLVTGALLSTAGSAEAGGRSLFRHRAHGHGAHDLETIQDRVSFFSGWILHKVDADDDQESAIEAILEAAISDLFQLHEGLAGPELRDEVVAVLTADSVDAEAVEALRRQHLETLDTVSARVGQALVEIGQVLTPEQRRELAQLAERRHHRWH